MRAHRVTVLIVAIGLLMGCTSTTSTSSSGSLEHAEGARAPHETALLPVDELIDLFGRGLRGQRCGEEEHGGG